jgi:hypothetical protein
VRRVRILTAAAVMLITAGCSEAYVPDRKPQGEGAPPFALIDELFKSEDAWEGITRTVFRWG